MIGNIAANYTNNNRVNFTSKMELKYAEEFAKRFENIAKIYSEKTKNFSNTMEVRKNHNGGLTFDYYDDNCSNYCEISVKQLPKLLKNTDEYIANKITKLTRIFENGFKEENAALQFSRKIERSSKNEEPFTEFCDKFWRIIMNKIEKDRNIEISKDSVLKEYKIF